MGRPELFTDDSKKNVKIVKEKFAESNKVSYLCNPKAVEQTIADRKGPVVQLVRMPPCHGGGRGFESRPVRKELHISVELFCFYVISRIGYGL